MTNLDDMQALIDSGLNSTKSRELVSSMEMADLLLDLRLLLITAAEESKDSAY
jgi:hypothetical protein